ncbi:unnamed protein product, partial [marine sediment metagenome]
NVQHYEDIHYSEPFFNNYSYIFNYTKEENYRYHPEAVKLTYIKYNQSANNGTVKFEYVENTLINIKTNISKIIFNITDNSGAYLENAIVHIYNETNTPTIAPSVSEITVQEDGSARFISFNNETKDWGNYTLLIRFASTYKEFGYNPLNWIPESSVKGLNFTFDTTQNISLAVQLNIQDYQTKFNESSYSRELEWGSIFTFKVSLMKTTEGTDNDPTWTIINNYDYVKWELRDDFGETTFFSGDMNSEGGGWFNYTVDSIHLIGNKDYYFIVTAKKTGYQNPDPLQMLFTVS